MLLPPKSRRGALVGAERTRRAIEALGIIHPENCAGYVNVSIGVAECNTLQEDQSVLMQCADAALYRAKNDKRNRVHGCPNARRLRTNRATSFFQSDLSHTGIRGSKFEATRASSATGCLRPRQGCEL